VARGVCWLAVLTCVRAIVGLACATPAAAQDAPDGEAQATESQEPAKAIEPEQEPDYLALADAPVFLPRSYLYWGTPVGPREQREPLVFALSYALHLPVYSNLRDQALAGKAWAGAATLSFEGDLRMLAISSKPVRMPSYRPSISGQLFYIFHGDVPALFGLRAGAFHYSNGQEECTFDPALRDESEACAARVRAVTHPSQELNRVSGDFTMNGWLLELHGRVHEINVHRVAVAQLALGLQVAGNLPLGAGSMTPELRKLFGWGRLGAELDGRRRFGWASLGVRASVSFYPNSGPRVPSTAGLVELTIGPYWLTGLAFFARYYGGRDFYNAFFVDSLQQFAAGLSWDGERPLKFKGETK
jgi:hypothetical protein